MQKATQKSSVCCCQEIATSALLAISSILRTRPLHYQIPLHSKMYRYGRSLFREPFFEAHQKQSAARKVGVDDNCIIGKETHHHLQILGLNRGEGAYDEIM